MYFTSKTKNSCRRGRGLHRSRPVQIRYFASTDTPTARYPRPWRPCGPAAPFASAAINPASSEASDTKFLLFVPPIVQETAANILLVLPAPDFARPASRARVGAPAGRALLEIQLRALRGASRRSRPHRTVWYGGSGVSASAHARPGGPCPGSAASTRLEAMRERPTLSRFDHA